MQLLQAFHLAYSQDGIHDIFCDLNLNFDRQRVGLMGPNGSGKSTLLQILAGHLMPKHGQVEVRAPSLWLPQLHSTNSWLEVFGQDLNPRVQAWWASECGEAKEQDLDLLQDSWEWIAAWPEQSAKWGVTEAPWQLNPAELSGGELQRLRLAVLTIAAHDILLLDEPSHHLDQTGRALLVESIKNFNGLLILASHDRELLRLMDCTIYLEQGRVQFYQGAYDFVQKQREKEQVLLYEKIHIAQEQLNKLKQQAQIVKQRQQKRSDRAKKNSHKLGLPRILIGARKRRSEESSARLQHKHSTKLAIQRNELMAEKSQLLKKVGLHFDLSSDHRAGQKRLVKAEELNFFFGNCPHPIWSKNLSFELKKGEKWWLKGANGRGKSSLLRAIAGELTAYAGNLRVFAKNLAYLDQKLAMLEANASLTSVWQDSCFIPDVSQRRIIAARLGLSGKMVDRSFSTLSGGERMRAALSIFATLKEPPDLVLLDEPGNHLDLQTQEVLLMTLQKLNSSLIVVSHEPDFVSLLGLDLILDLDDLI